MELYSMPQLDKTSPVFSDAQYEGGGDNINNQRTPTNDVKKYATVPADALPLLTSSASWNAVIHHPAEEDSEPDDLPSTVDMDAIKGSPATPLTASKTPPSNGANSWTQSKGDRCKREGAKEEAEASESEDSDGEDESDSQESDEDGDSGDSDSVNGSGSDSEGSESESCSWTDSDSESGSSSCSSRSGHSSRSSHTHQTFSIRETNFEQGGLKLKIAALKVTRKSSGKDSSKESGKDVGKEPTKEVLRDAPREVTKESESKKPTAAPAPKSSKDKAKFEKLPTQTSIAAAVPSQMSASTTPAPTPTGKSPSKVAVANALKKSEGVRRKPRAGRSTQKDKMNMDGRHSRQVQDIEQWLLEEEEEDEEEEDVPVTSDSDADCEIFSNHKAGILICSMHHDSY
ncbi:uncharacterized protein [Anabrus simplex]|uniref:uncharacterized protein isoform X1 n=1 Tax=Anabrus simplex TaxID=316456 RepID=UPI0035A3BEE5